MIELCYFSLDQWEIRIHPLWGKSFNIPHHCDTHLNQTKLNGLFPLTIHGVLESNLRTYENIYGTSKNIWHYPEINWEPNIDSFVQFEQDFNAHTEKWRVDKNGYLSLALPRSPDCDNNQWKENHHLKNEITFRSKLLPLQNNIHNIYMKMAIGQDNQIEIVTLHKSISSGWAPVPLWWLSVSFW